MAVQEIDETELLALRRNNELLSRALANPKAREGVLKGIKIAIPDLPIPELDAAAPLNAEMNAMTETLASIKKRMDDQDAKQEERDRMAKLQAGWSKTQQKAIKAGYAGESLEALEKFMEEKGVADHEIAMAAFEKMHPQAQPVNNTSGRFDFFQPRGDGIVDKALQDMREGKIDPNQFEQMSVDAILTEMRGAA